MTSFKEFITEMPAFSGEDKGKDKAHLADNRKRDIAAETRMDPADHGKKISTTKFDDHHDLVTHEKTHKFGKETKTDRTYHVVHRETGKIKLHMSGGWDKKTRKVTVGRLGASSGNAFGAHHFYHHLVHAGHCDELHSSNNQSHGASKVWHKLSKMRGTKMKMSDGSKLHRWRWHKNYASLIGDLKSPKGKSKFVVTKT